MLTVNYRLANCASVAVVKSFVYPGVLILEYLVPVKSTSFPLQIREFMQLAIDTSNALVAVHDHGIIHNGINPRYSSEIQ